MKILYDSQAFDLQTHGGVSRCFVELYKHLPDDVEAEIALIETDNVYLRNMGYKAKGETYCEFMAGSTSRLKRMLYKLHYNAKYGKYRYLDIMPNLNLYELERLLGNGDVDVFHPTFFDDYFKQYVGDIPFVITVHDMIPEIYPQYMRNELQRLQKATIIPQATHVVAVSEHTKKDLIEILKVPEEKISVVYHGVDLAPYIPSLKRPYDFEYILFVGVRDLYKNFIYFCRDTMPILRRHKELRVVCTGKPFTSEELYFMDAYGMKDRFIQTFVQSDTELLDLYHHAIAFVFPSAYEGFGIPILEAYKADCPVMLNRASCFPEIAGEAAVYFKMNQDFSDFEEQFETLYHLNSNEREALLIKQRDRMNRYSWEQSAKQLSQIYKNICL